MLRDQALVEVELGSAFLARDAGGDLLGSEIDLHIFFKACHLMTFSGLKKGFKKKVTRNCQKSAKKSSLVVVSKIFFSSEFFIPTSSVVGK